MRNLQSTVSFIQKPESSATAHRNSHFNRTADPTYYKNQKDDYKGRVPISFNFLIPQTLLLKEGKIQRWYYSNEMNQIKIHNEQRDWLEIMYGRTEDPTLPPLVSFRNPKVFDQSKAVVPKRQPYFNSAIGKDIMNL